MPACPKSTLVAFTKGETSTSTPYGSPLEAFITPLFLIALRAFNDGMFFEVTKIGELSLFYKKSLPLSQ